MASRRRGRPRPRRPRLREVAFATELVGEVREADDVVASGGGEGVEGGGFHLDGEYAGGAMALDVLCRLTERRIVVQVLPWTIGGPSGRWSAASLSRRSARTRRSRRVDPR